MAENKNLAVEITDDELDEMRGAVDGWDFKAYILGMLFYRYISENITNYINKGEWDTGNTDFDYTTLDDDTAECASSAALTAWQTINWVSCEKEVRKLQP